MAYLGIVRKTHHEPEKLIQSVDKYWGKWSNISRIESTQDSACRIPNTQDIISVVLLTRKNDEKADKSRQTTDLINSEQRLWQIYHQSGWVSLAVIIDG